MLDFYFTFSVRQWLGGGAEELAATILDYPWCDECRANMPVVSREELVAALRTNEVEHAG